MRVRPAEGSFDCAACGRPAARVLVLGPGQPTPRPVVGPPAGPAAGAFLGDRLRAVVDAVRFGGAMGGAAVESEAAALAAALEQGSAARLYAVDPEVARFWCPVCEASYCGRCWELWDVVDPEWPDWFEELRGRCPRGHERTILD